MEAAAPRDLSLVRGAQRVHLGAHDRKPEFRAPDVRARTVDQALRILRLRRLPVRPALVPGRPLRPLRARPCLPTDPATTSDSASSELLRDTGGSLLLTYWPSEFSQIRGQLRRTRYGEGLTANEFLFQFQFSMGAHGAHPF